LPALKFRRSGKSSQNCQPDVKKIVAGKNVKNRFKTRIIKYKRLKMDKKKHVQHVTVDNAA